MCSRDAFASVCERWPERAPAKRSQAGQFSQVRMCDLYDLQHVAFLASGRNRIFCEVVCRFAAQACHQGVRFEVSCLSFSIALSYNWLGLASVKLL